VTAVPVVRRGRFGHTRPHRSRHRIEGAVATHSHGATAEEDSSAG
jgi:hypothetical protein